MSEGRGSWENISDSYYTHARYLNGNLSFDDADTGTYGRPDTRIILALGRRDFRVFSASFTSFDDAPEDDN